MMENPFVKRQLEAINYEQNVGKLPVVEVFKTLQGEGIRIGTPSIFVRLAVCNLACVWCDTKYTWVPELLKRENIRWLTVDLLYDEIVDESGREIRNVVMTGGEPMLWWDKGLGSLCNRLANIGFNVEVETNGTIAPGGIKPHPNVKFNVSFKLSNNKANKKEERIVPEALKEYNELAKWGQANWKIVITKEEDLHELLRIIDELKLDKKYLLIMPEGVTPEKLNSYSWLAEWCAENGVRFINRLHIMLWGNERGR